MPNLGILKTLSICYYRIATEQEKDRKEEKRNVLYQRYREATFLFIFSFNGLLNFILFEDLKEVRGGNSEVFLNIYIFNDCIFIWTLLYRFSDLSVNASRVFKDKKINFGLLFLLRFPHLFRMICSSTSLWSV